MPILPHPATAETDGGGLWLRRARVRVPSVTLSFAGKTWSPASLAEPRLLQPASPRLRLVGHYRPTPHNYRDRSRDSRFCSVSPQTRFPSTDNSLRPVGNLELGENVGDIVAYRLRAQRQLPGN